ncbi:EF-Hand 1, calcium-binding site domain-containing protein, partial [Paramicrosporidium saccamoebae]
RVHLAFLQRLVQRYGTKGEVSRETFQRLVDEVELTLRSLPATAQVASQEGRYLANIFNSMALHRMRNHLDPINYKACISPFTYQHFGMTAYVGAHYAVFDLGRTYLADRFLAFWLWRSIYLSEQVSYRTRMMVAFDWAKTFLFGRNVSTP